MNDRHRRPHLPRGTRVRCVAGLTSGNEGVTLDDAWSSTQRVAIENADGVRWYANAWQLELVGEPVNPFEDAT